MTTGNSTDAFTNPPHDYFNEVTNTIGIDRPERTEDRVPRDSYGKPRILPVGKKMPEGEEARYKALRSYFRPSSFAEVLEDHYNLNRWSERMIATGLMSERRLQLAYANIGNTEEDSESKKAANEILLQAKRAARAEDKAEEGTGVHALTERYDLNLPIPFVPTDFQGNLEDWKRLTEHFEILDVECFVVEDEYLLAGTFDRLIRYHQPCDSCGAYLRILDLKTGTIEWGGMKMAAQLGIYAHGKKYDPATGERISLGDVCTCRGIIIHIPSGAPQGTGVAKWLNIAQGWEKAVRLASEVRRIRNAKGWWLDFEPIPDIMPLIEDATTREELSGLFRLHRSHWTPAHTEAGRRRIKELGL